MTDLVIKNQHLEILSPTSLNIVTFRYINKKIDENLINDFNAELLMRLHETGEHAPSSALLNGIFSIRVAITNHRSRLNDFNKLVDDVVIIGNDMLKDYI